MKIYFIYLVLFSLPVDMPLVINGEIRRPRDPRLQMLRQKHLFKLWLRFSWSRD
jgi:hypothetical protein